jgi:hypothetical protein
VLLSRKQIAETLLAFINAGPSDESKRMVKGRRDVLLNPCAETYWMSLLDFRIDSGGDRVATRRL